MSAPNPELLLGQRIVGAIRKEGKGPASQLYLIFEDGTHTEFYSDDRIRVSAGWPGGVERARAYMASTHKITYEAYLPVTAGPESAEAVRPSAPKAGGRSASGQSLPIFPQTRRGRSSSPSGARIWPVGQELTSSGVLCSPNPRRAPNEDGCRDRRGEGE
jgi:hypothetical protein